MRAYYCDHFVLPLPQGHRFPMEKYRLLRERIVNEIPTVGMYVPAAATHRELARVHSTAYIERVLRGRLTKAEVRRIGFPWSPELVERSRRSVGGTVAAARAALEKGASVNLAGGTHHAFSDRGEGFCVFNDVAVSILAMRAEGRINRAAVIDLDVHQGNGTASIFRTDPLTFTGSVHGEHNFPFEKTDSDLDIALPDGAGDEEYTKATRRMVEAAFSSRPELVYYLAGADPFSDDRLGRLLVTKAALADRDRQVTLGCAARGIPIVIVMSGGYAADVNDTVDIHFESIRTLVGAVRRAA